MQHFRNTDFPSEAGRRGKTGKGSQEVIYNFFLKWETKRIEGLVFAEDVQRYEQVRVCVTEGQSYARGARAQM